jgi:hypothetical protein
MFLLTDEEHIFIHNFYNLLLDAGRGRGSPGKTNLAYVEDSDEDEGDGGRGGQEEAAGSSVLPWKRNNTDAESNKPMKQSEFPSWINNKEYTQNYSPYSTVNQGK